MLSISAVLNLRLIELKREKFSNPEGSLMMWVCGLYTYWSSIDCNRFHDLSNGNIF